MTGLGFGFRGLKLVLVLIWQQRTFQARQELAHALKSLESLHVFDDGNTARDGVSGLQGENGSSLKRKKIQVLQRKSGFDV